MRVPVLVGHAEAIWVETEEPLSPEDARELLARRRASASRTSRLPARPPAATASSSAAIRRDPTAENGLCLFLAGDNLRKGAALNAIQIAELLLGAGAAA